MSKIETTRLLKLSPIFLDESLQSYLARISMLNYYNKINTVERLAEDRSGKYLAFRYDKYIELAKLTNQPTHLLIRASLHPYLEFKRTNTKDLLFCLSKELPFLVPRPESFEKLVVVNK